MTDTRIVYGARCTWWDSIDKIGRLPGAAVGHRLPCCPDCHSVLYEVPDEAAWWAGVDKHEAAGHPGYRKFVEWGRGRCFSTMGQAKAAYEAEEGLIR